MNGAFRSGRFIRQQGKSRCCSAADVAVKDVTAVTVRVLDRLAVTSDPCGWFSG